MLRGLSIQRVSNRRSLRHVRRPDGVTRRSLNTFINEDIDRSYLPSEPHLLQKHTWKRVVRRLLDHGHVSRQLIEQSILLLIDLTVFIYLYKQFLFICVELNWYSERCNAKLGFMTWFMSISTIWLLIIIYRYYIMYGGVWWTLLNPRKKAWWSDLIWAKRRTAEQDMEVLYLIHQSEWAERSAECW